jgi:hypothetical protein
MRLFFYAEEDLAFHNILLDFADGAGGIEALGACLGAIHNGVTAVQRKGIIESLQPLSPGFISAVGEPPARLQQHSGA